MPDRVFGVYFVFTPPVLYYGTRYLITSGLFHQKLVPKVNMDCFMNEICSSQVKIPVLCILNISIAC